MATAAQGPFPFPHHRTCAEAPIPPDGCSEIPAEMLWEPVAGTLGMETPDHRNPEFRTAMILVAAICTEPKASNLARWSGYSEAECARVVETMTRNGIWKDGQPDGDRYCEGDDRPGLQIGDMALVLDTLLCLGKVRYAGNDLWCGVKEPLTRDRRRIDEFAEHLANGLSVPEAAKLVGATPRYGNAMLQRIRHRLGAQAA